jgi:hypothetical protein
MLGEDACGPTVIDMSTGGVFLLNQSNFRAPHGYVGVTVQQNGGKVVPAASISGGPLGQFAFMTGTDLESSPTCAKSLGRDVPQYLRTAHP